MDVTSNRNEHDREFKKAAQKALRLVGGQAERFAKEMISDMGAVDTGFLRNSITFAISGEAPNIVMYSDDDSKKMGEYNGVAPDDDDDSLSVYIGTNVYYAPYVEYGTSRMIARPFLAQSIQLNADTFKELFERAFTNFMH